MYLPLGDSLAPTQAPPEVPILGPDGLPIPQVPTINIVGDLTCEQMNAERAQYYLEQGLGPAPQDDCTPASKKSSYAVLLYGTVFLAGLLLLHHGQSSSRHT